MAEFYDRDGSDGHDADTAAIPVELVGKMPGTRRRVHTVWLDGSRLIEIELSGPHVAFVSCAAEWANLAFVLDRKSSLAWNDVEVTDDVVLQGSGRAFHLRSNNVSRWGVVSIARRDLGAYASALLGRELEPAGQFARLRVPSAAMHEIRRLHRQACRLSMFRPDILARREVARALHQDMVCALVDGLGAAAPAVTSATDLKRTDIVLRFEQAFAAAPLHDRSLPALCATIGIAERTLQESCRAVLGCSAVAYLRLRRLHRARELLVSGNPATATVAAMAASCGFRQPGRFAVDYRRLFGERPSQTLRTGKSDSAESA